MRQKIFSLAAAAFVTSASLAYAGTTAPQTQSYSANTNWGTVSNPIALNFTGFDTSLGTLTGVTVYAEEVTSGTVQNTNNGSDASGIDSWLVNTWTATLPSMLNGLSKLTDTSVSDDQYDILDPGSTGDLTSVGGNSNASVTSAAGDVLTAFESAFTIAVKDIGGVTVSADNGNGKSAYSDTGKVTVTVTYTYDAAPTPAPEPTTLALVGSSLLGLGLIRRRRR